MTLSTTLIHLALLAPILPGPQLDDVEDLSLVLEPLVAEHDVPALGCALMYEGRLIAHGAFGVRKRGAPETVTVDDAWHLGSCTKAITATLIARLVERGELAFERTLAESFPELEIHADLRTVSLEDLLCHRAGLMQNPTAGSLWQRLQTHPGPATEARALVVQEVLPLAPDLAPRTRTAYSNTGYVVAGALAERTTGRSWEELVAREVFAPLGVEGAGFGPPGVPGELTQPRGHLAAGLAFEPDQPLADNPPALGPAGTIHASLADWARLVGVHAFEGGEGESVFLSRDTLSALHRPRDDEGTYALGWAVAEREWGGGTVLTHAGSNGRWFCVAWVAPRAGIVLLATCNQGGPRAQAACDEACVELLQYLEEVR